MPSIKYLAKFSDDDVYTMLYLYHLKGESLTNLQWRFSIGLDALEGFLEGCYRKECYESFRAVEQILECRG